MCIQRNTVSAICNRFISNGYKFQEMKFMRKLNQIPDLEDWLCSTEVLREWAPKTLDQRCNLIEQQYGIKVSRFTLQKLYKKRGITHRVTGRVWRTTPEKEEELHERRIVCAR